MKIKLFITSKEIVCSKPVLNSEFKFIVEGAISLSKWKEINSRLVNLLEETNSG